jgi:type II secretory pathway component PulJ
MLNLLMGWALSLSLLSAGALWLNLQWQNDRQIRLRTHKQQDIRALMDTLVHDIRRANFQALMPNGMSGNTGACPSAFCGLPEDLEINRHQILFSVDRNNNGVKDNNECSGFRQNGKLIQTKTSCSPVVWTSLTTLKTLEVNDLRFQLLCMPDGLTASSVILISLSTQTTFQSMPTDWQRYVQLRNQHWSVQSPPCDALVG